MVTTRLMASVIAIVPLYILCLGVSYLSTQVIVSLISGGSMGGYMHYFGLMLSGKEIFFRGQMRHLRRDRRCAAVLLRLLRQRRTRGVGAAGHAMRAAIVVVVIMNMLLTMAMFSLSSGARFGG